MTEYHLVGYEPYEPSFTLFSGAEEELRDYVQQNKRSVTMHSVTGREYNVIKISGYLLDDLDVLIQGPDVRTYLE